MHLFSPLWARFSKAPNSSFSIAVRAKEFPTSSFLVSYKQIAKTAVGPPLHAQAMGILHNAYKSTGTHTDMKCTTE